MNNLMADLFRDTVVALDKQKRLASRGLVDWPSDFGVFLTLTIPDSRGTAGRSTVLSKLVSRGEWSMKLSVQQV